MSAAQPIGALELSRTILFVEDEVLVRLFAADELRAAGFKVIEAATGEEALALLESGTGIDVLLTDIRLPGDVDGVAIAAAFRKKRPEVKIIIASGTALPPGEVVDATFIKPYDVAAIASRINRLVPPTNDS